MALLSLLMYIPAILYMISCEKGSVVVYYTVNNQKGYAYEKINYDPVIDTSYYGSCRM